MVVYSIVYLDVKIGFVLLLLPGVIFFFVRLFQDPRFGIYSLFVLNYFVMGISRYMSGSIPIGLAIDGVLIITYIALVLKRANFRPASRDLTLLAVIWYTYALFEFFNPESASHQAWFYAMRGYSLYFLLTIPLTFILLNHRRDLDNILTLLSIFTLLAVAKGLMQFSGHLDSAELQWLAEGGAKTHIVGGKLRVFSFFTDAGQYGASMGYSGIVFLISSIGMSGRRRLYYWFVASLAFLGMFLSGTRGAMAVPAAGIVMYILISGNVKQIVTMTIVALSIFSFFKFTHIGDSNYQIARMRTAFSGNDASMQQRLINRAKLKTYLADRPFGGGIGSSGNWGTRFSPNTFLADTPTDSWYVAIWAEQGIVGLALHLIIIFYSLIKGAFLVMRVRNQELAFKLKAFLCGFAGIALASYTNGVMGQMPTGIIIYISLGFIFMAPEFDKQINEKVVH